MSDAYILDAVRTPFGRYGGALAGVRPDDLGAHVVEALLDARARPRPRADRRRHLRQRQRRGRGQPQRRAAWPCCSPGLPTTVPGATPSTASAARASTRRCRPAAPIETGDADVVLVGGVESMSRAPWVVLKPEKGFPAGPHDDALDDARLAHGQPGHARRSGRSRSARAPRSSPASTTSAARRRTRSRCAATSAPPPPGSAGFYDDWVVPVAETELVRDEGIRADTSLEKLAKLKPAFVKDGTVTAGNASPLNDGASAVLIASEAGAQKAGREPLARIAGRGTFAVDPDIFGIGPVEAANRALKRAGIGWDDVDAVELNEAFAAQSLACLGEWPDLDPERVNVNGGAIAIGHPLGASGGRILGTLAYTLQGQRLEVRRRRDLHRRRPGPGDRPGGGVTTSETTPTATRRSTTRATSRRALRHPKQPLIALPQRLTEITGAGPRRGPPRRARPRPHPPARRRAAWASGSSSTATSRRTTGGPCPTRWSRSGRPTPAAATATAGTTGRAPLDPNFTRRRALPDRQGRLLPLRHDPARRLPVGQPRQRLAPRAHPLQPVRARVHAAARDADVLPGRPAVLPGPDVQLGRRPRPEGRAADDQRASTTSRPRSSGRSRSAGTSCCAARRPRRPRSRTHDARLADRRPVPLDRAAVAGRPGRRARGHAGPHPPLRQVFDGAGELDPRRADRDLAGRPRRQLRHATSAASAAAPTNDDGDWEIFTVKPGALGDGQAKHIDVSVFARGMLNRCVTRIYFADEDNARRPGARDRPGGPPRHAARAARPTTATASTSTSRARVRPSSSSSDDSSPASSRAAASPSRSAAARGCRRCSSSRPRSRARRRTRA